MPFSYSNKSAGDLIRSQDWNAAMAGIAALFDRLNGTSGHHHTGTPEDGPQIATAGLADLAVTLQKLADLAVNTAKLADNAVTAPKIANGAVVQGKIANNAVGNANIVDDAVTTTKIQDGAVTASKLAVGAMADYGFALAALTHGQTAPVPNGFARNECIYHWGMKYLTVNFGSPNSYNLNTSVHPVTGDVSIGQYALFTGVFTQNSDFGGYVHVLTIAKRGGW